MIGRCFQARGDEMRILALTIGAVFVDVPVCNLCFTGADATGRVIGVVTDPAGAAVPGARITVTNSATGVSRETISAGDGA